MDQKCIEINSEDLIPISIDSCRGFQSNTVRNEEPDLIRITVISTSECTR